MTKTSEQYCLSIALITRNRPESLRRGLNSIRGQCLQPFEVLIGDDSDPDRAGETRKLAEEFGCRYFPPAEPRGVFRNRNRLARAARGTHVRTMDDDHEVPPGHIERCMQAVESEPEAVWFTAEHWDGVPEPYRTPPCPGQLNARGFGEVPPDPQRCWAISDGATIFPRSVYERGHYYYDYFLFGSAFMELGCRLAWLGYHIRLLEGTYVIHHTGESHRKKDSIWYGSNQVILGSRFYAALCHSFIYRRSIRNQAVTCLEILKELALRRGVALRSLREAIQAYHEVKGHLNGDAPSVC